MMTETIKFLSSSIYAQQLDKNRLLNSTKTQL